MAEARETLSALVGETVTTLSGRANRVLRVDGESVWVGTDRSPEGEPVPIAWVQSGIDQLEARGEVVVDVPTLGHRSAFVGAILAQLPGAETLRDPQRVRLVDTSPRDAELEHRNSMWEELNRTANALAAEPSALHALGIYGGASGIWVDKARTKAIAPVGVAVALLHTGRHYPDDLSESALLYHYPVTDRPPARDAAEVEATKECGRMRLPLFVILPSRERTTLREVRRGWIESWDDESAQFLVSFEPERAGASLDAPVEPQGDGASFSLISGRADRTVAARARPNQPRFRMAVLQRYGPRCAVCDVEALEVLKAAHIVPANAGGTDDPRNGLVLCANHHDALDRGLYGIEPESLQVRCLGRYSAAELGLLRPDLRHLRAKPHRDALAWLWAT